MTALMEKPTPRRTSRSTLLELRGLSVDYGIGAKRARAVDGVDLAIHEGEIVGLAGESGCGKSTVAIALSLHPELIILDEPTTALDVVVQREILQQVEALKRDFGFAVLFITHDLSLLLEFADRIAIMYAGEIVEVAPAERLGTNPQHPYTQRLLESFPPLSGPLERLSGIPGSPPDLPDPPSGCRFHPPCPHCGPERPELYVRQTTERPVLREAAPGHRVACHLVEEEVA